MPINTIYFISDTQSRTGRLPMKTEQLMLFLIYPHSTVVEAMQKIDVNAKGILFVVFGVVNPTICILCFFCNTEINKCVNVSLKQVVLIASYLTVNLRKLIRLCRLSLCANAYQAQRKNKKDLFHICINLIHCKYNTIYEQ